MKMTFWEILEEWGFGTHIHEAVNMVQKSAHTVIKEMQEEYLTCSCGRSDETVQEREDPYAADVNDNPGVMIIVCSKCYQELADAI